jgi:hypothetical protein
LLGGGRAFDQALSGDVDDERVAKDGLGECFTAGSPCRLSGPAESEPCSMRCTGRKADPARRFQVLFDKVYRLRTLAERAVV